MDRKTSQRPNVCKFFDSVQSLNNIFFVQNFDIVWVINTEGFDWFIRPFYTKGFEVLSLDDPIHIPSVLDELITSPDKFLNTSQRL